MLSKSYTLEPIKRFKYFFEAQLALRNNQFQVAKKNFLLCFRIHPNAYNYIAYQFYKEYNLQKNPQILVELAEFYFSTHHYECAISECEDLFEQNFTYLDIFPLLNKCYATKVQTKRVVLLCERAIQMGIFNQHIIDVLSKHYTKTLAHTKHIRLYENLIKLKPEYGHFHLTLVELHLRNQNSQPAWICLEGLYKQDPNRHQEIFTLLKRLLYISPAHKQALFLSIQLGLELNELDAAFEYARDYLCKKFPTNQLISLLSRHHKTLPENLELMHILADCYVTIKQVTNATDLNRNIFIKNPKNQHKACLKRVLNLLELEPNHVETKLLHLDILIFNKRFDVIFAMISSLLDDSPSLANQIEERLQAIHQQYPDTHSNIQLLFVKCYYLQKKYSTCLNLCESILEQSACSETRSYQVLANVQLGQLQTAQDIYPTLLKDNPLSPTVLVEKQLIISSLAKPYESEELSIKTGLSFYAQGETKKALNAFQKIDQKNSNYWLAQACCGRCFIDMGRFDLANDQFNVTLQKDIPNTLRHCLLYWMSLNHLNQGQISLAIHQMEHIYKQDISFLNIDAKLQQYKKNLHLDLSGKLIALLPLHPNNPKLIPVVSKTPILDYPSKKMRFETISFAQTQNNDGAKHVLSNHLANAKTSFQLALELDPLFPVSKLNLLAVNLILNQQATLESQFLEEKDLIREHPAFKLLFAIHYFINYQFEKAQEFASQAETCNEIKALAQLLLGDIFFKQNDINQAIQYWHLARSYEPLFFFLKQRELSVSSYYEDPEKFLCDFELNFSI